MSITDGGSHYDLAEKADRSTVKVYKVTYEWTIDHFDICEERESKILSPEFSAYGNDYAKWFLKLKPNGRSESEEAISLYLGLSLSKNCEHEAIFAKYSASIIDNKQQIKFSLKSKKVHKFEDGTCFGWGRFCQKDEDFRRNLLLSNNELKIYFEIMFSMESDDIEHQRYRNSPYPMSTSADRDVTEDLDILFKTHLLSDVVISVQSKEYPAHKAILAARSKVFAAMFEHEDTKENQLNRVEIVDLSEETVDELLRFIYTGKCEKLNELARDLLFAAEKYDLNRLKIDCTKALCDNLSIENAAQILILAHMYNADELKNQVINFIVSKPKEVFDTDDWKKVEQESRLLSEVCRAMARR